MKHLFLFWVVTAVVFLAGCTGVMDQRISAHEETWRGLPEDVRHRLKLGLPQAGDTEEMVRIALGPPDDVLSLTSAEGLKQTVWLYDSLDYENDIHPQTPLVPPPSNSSVNRGRRITFQDGIMRYQRMLDARDLWELPTSRDSTNAVDNVMRLNAVVTLTPEQKQIALEIFAKACDQLSALSRGERGRPIWVKMRADLRAMLTADQQAKYDAAPPVFRWQPSRVR